VPEITVDSIVVTRKRLALALLLILAHVAVKVSEMFELNCERGCGVLAKEVGVGTKNVGNRDGTFFSLLSIQEQPPGSKRLNSMIVESPSGSWRLLRKLCSRIGQPL
jgi:hypothetical protein